MPGSWTAVAVVHPLDEATAPDIIQGRRRESSRGAPVHEDAVIEQELEVAKLRITADAGVDPQFRDFNSFFWDLSLLYELELLAQLDPEFLDRSFGSPWILSRGGRPIPSHLRMRVERASFGSPIDLTVWIPLVPVVIGALYVLAKSVEKIYLIPATHRLLEAQARRENATARSTEADAVEHEIRNAARVAKLADPLLDAEARVSNAPGFHPIASVERRLSRSPIRITTFEIEVEDRKPPR